MEEQHSPINSEMMSAPSYKLLVTTPMAAIMVSGKPKNEWSDLLESIGLTYASAAGETHGEINAALETVAFMLQGGDRLIRKYFENDDLNLDRMMEISATGADVWMCKLGDGEIEKPDVIKLFQTIQAGLIETVGDLREENEMIEQLIQVQDKVVEHINSLS